jgi:murein DD-endopeptidase MepM/ murein hydrolase activator NlpD
MCYDQPALPSQKALPNYDNEVSLQDNQSNIVDGSLIQISESLQKTAAHPFVIPGSGEIAGPLLPPKARRTLHLPIAIIASTIAIVLLVLLSVTPLNQSFIKGGSTFQALAKAIVEPPPPTWTLYRVQSGDTFDRIATRLHISINGIYEINNFTATQELMTGQYIRVSTDPHYGANYTPPAPPSIYDSNSSLYNTGNGCLFCVRAGSTNGAGNLCATASTERPIDPSHFHLIVPENNPTWVRGFSWYHNGVDITTGSYGTPIFAAQDGVVIFAGWDPGGGGNSVKINHCGGLATSYSHMQKLLVQVGQAVHTGDTIGLQGSTGNATGPHVHFMTWWNNQPFDPLCIFGTIAGVSESSHYGGCPPPQMP